MTSEDDYDYDYVTMMPLDSKTLPDGLVDRKPAKLGVSAPGCRFTII